MNKVPDKIKISYLLVEIFERPLIENIGILYNYGPAVRGKNAQRLLVQSENTRTFVRASPLSLALFLLFISGLLGLKVSLWIRPKSHLNPKHISITNP